MSSREQRLLTILKALSSSGRKALRVPSLMKRAGYKTWEALRKDLEYLESQELIAFAKSGFPSDSHLHHKVVIMRADVVNIFPQEEEEVSEQVGSESPQFKVLEEQKSVKIEVSSAVRLFTVRFFELVRQRAFEKAQRMLHRIRVASPKIEWFKGYYYALNGVLIAEQSNDERLFVKSIKSEDLLKTRDQFRNEAKNPLHGDYDRGFFYVMAQYCHVRQILEKNISSVSENLRR